MKPFERGNHYTEEIGPLEAQELCHAGALLIDVRELDEWNAGHAPDARHVPLGQLDPAQFDHGSRIVTVCRSGNRSAFAATELRRAGFAVSNLAGGMKAWASAGLSVTSSTGDLGVVI